MAGNYFDRFDAKPMPAGAPLPADPAQAAGGNFFDQFDPKPIPQGNPRVALPPVGEPRGALANSAVQAGEGLKSGLYKLPGVIGGDLPNIMLQGLGGVTATLNKYLTAPVAAAGEVAAGLGQPGLKNTLDNSPTFQQWRSGVSAPMPQIPFSGATSESALRAVDRATILTDRGKANYDAMQAQAEPQTDAGRYVRAGAEMIPGGPLSKVGIAGSVAGGMAGQAAQDAGAGPIAQLIATLGGGLGTTAAIEKLRNIGAGVSRLFNPELQAAKTVQGEAAAGLPGMSPNVAGVQTVDDIARTQAVTGDLPLSLGQASDNPALLASERGRRISSEEVKLPDGTVTNPQAQFRDLNQRQAENVKGDVQKMAPPPGDPMAANDFVAGGSRAQMAADMAEVRNAERATEAARQAEIDAGSKVAPMANERVRNDASAAATGVVKDQLAADTAEKSGLYDAVDPNRSVSVDAKAVNEAAAKATKPSGPLDTSPAAVNKYAGDIVAKLQKAEGITAADLQDVRAGLSDAIAAARKDGNAVAMNRLIDLKKSIEAQVAALPEAQAANKFFKEDFAPRWAADGTGRQTAGADVRQAARSGGIEPTTTLPKTFLSSEERAADLKRIFDASPNAAAGNDAVRKYLSSDMAASILNKDGAVDPVRLRKWMDNNGGVLRQFPEAQAEATALLRDTINKRQATGKMAAELDAAKKSAAATEESINNSAAALFLNKDPSKTVQAIFSGENPAKSMKEALDLVKQDKSGKAAAGFQQAVFDEIEKRVSGINRDVHTDVADVTRQKLEALNKDPAIQRMLTTLYADQPEKLALLKQAQDKLQVMSRSSRTASSGSDTTEKLAAAAAQAGKDTTTVLFGFRAGRLADLTAKIAGFALKDKLPTAAVEGYITRAYVNPEYAKTLLLMDTAPKRAESLIMKQLAALSAKSAAGQQTTQP